MRPRWLLLTGKMTRLNRRRRMRAAIRRKKMRMTIRKTSTTIQVRMVVRSEGMIADWTSTMRFEDEGIESISTTDQIRCSEKAF